MLCNQARKAVTALRIGGPRAQSQTDRARDLEYGQKLGIPVGRQRFMIAFFLASFQLANGVPVSGIPETWKCC